MKKTELTEKLSRSIHKFGLKLKHHSPEILTVTGIIGVTASAVLACKATTKINFVLDDTAKKTDIIHEGVENGEVKSEVNGEIVLVPYSEEDGKKDLTIVYAKTGLQLAKLYAPAVILGVASIGCILASANIMRKRNAALAAAYAAVDTGFKQYRSRVIDRFGKELDQELRYNIKAKEVEETVVQEDGTETTVKTTVNVVNPNEISEYARFFDDGNLGWTKDPEYNLMYLRHQQNYANDILRTRGHLFLNEVYDLLGIPRSKAGQIVGWVYDPEDETRDNFVDFGIYDNVRNPKASDFVNGYERTILLDFNVDGVVVDLLK